MGTECMSTCVKEEIVDPSIPPGFGSLTSFTLKKMDNCEVPMSSMASMDVCKPQSAVMDAKFDVGDDAKVTRCLRRRPWINYSKFNNSSDEDSESEQVDQNLSLNTQLPKGVIRGCMDCYNCQKVVARSCPNEAMRPILEDAPVFYPTEEEFEDTLKYIASIRPKAEHYGICRIVPPSSWKPPCPLKEDNVWKNSKFSTRIQRIDKLQNRDSLRKRSRLQRKVNRKRRRGLEMGMECGMNGNVLQPTEAENFGFEPGPQFTLEAFQKYANDFKGQYFQNEAGTNSGDNQSFEKELELPIGTIEGEYWRMVEKPTEEIEVLYGADLETGVFGSGFPKVSSSMECCNDDERYLNSGWNLNKFARLPGSVLSFENGDISGVLVPWLYIGMCFSSFCWHVEDHHFYSMNYMHWGAPKIWYGVPGEDALKLEAAMRKHLPDLFEEQPDLLHKLVTQLSPSILKSEGVPVYRCVQNPREFVLTFPRAYHSGFNCGFNCAEAVNVAPLDWLPHGQNAVELYREQGRKTSVSHDKMLLGAAREAVRAQWEISLLKRNTLDNVRWKDVCGRDGFLAKALQIRVDMERVRREYHCTSLRAAKMDASFDATCERECVVCFYDLHLSAVGCQCSPERFACLSHSKHLCSCPWSAKTFLVRYEISELNILVEALGGKLSAIYRWAKLDLGLALSSYITKDNTGGPDSVGSQSHSIEVLKQKNGCFKTTSSTSINGVPTTSYQDKKPAIQVTTLNDTICRPSVPSETKQKEHGLLDEIKSFSGYSGPPGFYQSFKARLASSSNEQKTRELPPLNEKSTEAVSTSSDPSQLCVLGHFSVKKEIPDNFHNSMDGSPVLSSNILDVPVCQLSKEDVSYAETSQGRTSSTHCREGAASIHRNDAMDISVSDEPKRKKLVSSGDQDVILLSDDECEDSGKICSSGATEESSKYSEVSARLTNTDAKVSSYNHQNDQVLDTPDTNASVLSEGDITMISGTEKGDQPLHEVLVKIEKNEVDHGCVEYNFMDPSNHTKIESAAGNLSCSMGSSSVCFGKATQDLISARESSDYNADGGGNLQPLQLLDSAKSIEGKTEEKGLGSDLCLTENVRPVTGSLSQSPQLHDSENSNVGKNENKSLGSDLSLTETARTASGSSSLTPTNLDRNYRQKGPRLARVVRRISINVEQLEIGTVLPGKSWSCSRAIFPKGFKSRVCYISVVDPTKKCFYLSEILDAGSIGPLFMVMVEGCPNEVFIHKTASKCWDMVRDKINQEIRKQHAMGKTHLPPLQPPGSLDGLEMFGFTSPAIIQATEAMDRNRVCTEYWKSRSLVQRLQHPLASEVTAENAENDQKANLIKRLFKKADPEELNSLYSILSDNKQAIDHGTLTKLLVEEIQNRPR